MGSWRQAGGGWAGTHGDLGRARELGDRLAGKAPPTPEGRGGSLVIGKKHRWPRDQDIGAVRRSGNLKLRFQTWRGQGSG